MTNSAINISPEDCLINICAQADISNNIKNKLNKTLLKDLNWSYVLENTTRQGTTPLFYYNLSEYNKSVPENIWQTLEETYYTNAYRNIRIYTEIGGILSSFKKENLKVIPLKGVFLAEKVYNNIALRTMGDIDILVKKEDLPKIDKPLRDLGYKMRVHEKLLSHAIEKSYMNSIDYFKTGEKSPVLHIHWHMVNVSLPTYMYTRNIEMDRFWREARPTKIADVQTLQLAPHHLIIYLAEHALKHSFDRLILLSDIDAAIKRYTIDWKRLAEEAGEFGMERQLYYGLYFTKYFLDADMPDEILSRLKPKRLAPIEQHFFRSVSNNKRNAKLSYLVYLNMTDGVINKLRFVFRTLFPPPSVLALFFNINKPKVSINDYLIFLRKQFFHLKKAGEK